MNKLDLNIFYLISGFLDFLSKIRFRSISKYSNLLEIHDFYNIEEKYLILLNDKILLNYPFIRSLNAYNNPNITNVNYMEKLIELNASSNCGITNEGIKNIKLTKLKAYNNTQITNINHMAKSLVELDVSWRCGINNEGIKNLKNIRKLCISNNKNINDINHMKKLIELDASCFDCGLTDSGIKELNLKILYSTGNKKIKNVNHMNKLIEFNVSEYCDFCNNLL
jgi:uncharacterized protein YutD